MAQPPASRLSRESVRLFFKPYLKRQFALLAVAGILIITAFVIWLKQPQDVPLPESQRKKVLCLLWRNTVDLQLSSLRTKFITDRDAYLFQGYQRLENTINSGLAACLDMLEGYQARAFKRTLETLAVQLTQKDDEALTTLNEVAAIFLPKN